MATVAILGAGGIGLGSAAWPVHGGHRPIPWSPGGTSTASLAAGAALAWTGVVEGSARVDCAASVEQALREAQCVLVAAPVNAHRALMDAACPTCAPSSA